MFRDVAAESLGAFEVPSGVMGIGDPCYSTCEEVLEVRPGTWAAYLVRKDTHVAALIVLTSTRYFQGHWNLTGGIDVDSGSAGLYDLETFRDDSVVKREPEFRLGRKEKAGDRWYRMCCTITLSPEAGGTIPYGVVGKSGYGDGVYPYYTRVDNGEIVGIALEFIPIEPDTCDDCGEVLSRCYCDEICPDCEEYHDECSCDIDWE